MPVRALCASWPPPRASAATSHPTSRPSMNSALRTWWFQGLEPGLLAYGRHAGSENRRTRGRGHRRSGHVPNSVRGGMAELGMGAQPVGARPNSPEIVA